MSMQKIYAYTYSCEQQGPDLGGGGQKMVQVQCWSLPLNFDHVIITNCFALLLIFLNLAVKYFPV